MPHALAHIASEEGAILELRYGLGVGKGAAPGPEIERRLAEAAALHRAGRLDEAASAYDEIMRRAPRSGVAWSMRGVLELQRGRTDSALAWLTRAAELDPRSAGILINCGNALRALGRFDESVAAYRRALALDPALAIAHNNLGNSLRDLDRLGEAAESFRRALALDPSSFAAAANLAHLLARDETTTHAEQLDAYDRALALASDSRSRDVANLHNARANVLRADDHLDESIVGYRAAIDIDAAFAQAHVNLGQGLIRTGALAEAVAVLRRAVALDAHEREAYRHLASALRRIGNDRDAALVYAQWHAALPDDPIAAHMVHAGRGGEPPARGSDEYVRREFDGFAEHFDESLAQLGYRAPQLLAAQLERSPLGSRRDLQVLDAGCGTGLCAAFLRPRAAQLVGVDLSPKMLELARARGGYDELVAAELTEMAKARPGRFDLIVAADVLTYFGALDEVLTALRGALRCDGMLLFTTEHGDDDDRGWQLGVGGRYAHGHGHLRAASDRAGLSVVVLEADVLRNERGAPVRGWVVAARA